MAIYWGWAVICASVFACCSYSLIESKKYERICATYSQRQLIFLSCLCDAKDGTQGFLYGRQTLYHWATYPPYTHPSLENYIQKWLWDIYCHYQTSTDLGFRVLYRHSSWWLGHGSLRGARANVALGFVSGSSLHGSRQFACSEHQILYLSDGETKVPFPKRCHVSEVEACTPTMPSMLPACMHARQTGSALRRVIWKFLKINFFRGEMFGKTIHWGETRIMASAATPNCLICEWDVPQSPEKLVESQVRKRSGSMWTP